MNATKITIEATVSADAKKVWNYYTNPAHITKWNFASDDWQCPHATNDMRPGGKYAARMEAKDGSFGFDFEAIYDEVVEGKKIAYTMTDGRQASVNFRNLDSKTEVVVIFDAETENPIEMQREGWLSILNNFKKYTEAN
jgi:uncharacterized protein YndB with AHSA1/START domain